MIGHKKNLLTACFAALLALGLAACGTTGDDAAPAAMMDDDEAGTPAPPGAGAELTELEVAQKAAADAATAADGFATAAETDAENAADAAMGRARFQTTPSSYAHAADAKEHAVYARTAADDAQTAADKAATATTITAAVLAQGEAERARDSAETHGGHVTGFHDDAVAVAANEVFVVDGEHNKVGDTTIMADGRTRSETVDGKAVNTGLISSMAVDTPGARTMNGLLIVDAEGVPADGRMAAGVVIGVTHDSADDSARLTLVKSYLGTQKQMQFVRDGVTSPFTGPDVGAPSGGQNLAPNADLVDLITNGAVTIAQNVGANTAEVVAVPKVAGGDFRAVDAVMTGVTLYYVNSDVADVTTGDTDDGVDQTKIYLERSSDSGTVTYDVVTVVEVTLDFAADYQHFHYGLWNGLGGSGGNTVSDLGIGFVAAIADGMMTEVMPNYGNATYKGNWVANVQEASPQGDGTITRQDGVMSMMADWAKNTVDVTLTGLITLEGDIAGNEFSGEKAAVHDMDADMMGVQNNSGLAAGAKLEGSFKGGFFGTLAAEAGGVFAFWTDDNEDGAVNGAFGGK